MSRYYSVSLSSVNGNTATVEVFVNNVATSLSVNISWGDGSSETDFASVNNANFFSHTYSSSGSYTIVVRVMPYGDTRTYPISIPSFSTQPLVRPGQRYFNSNARVFNQFNAINPNPNFNPNLTRQFNSNFNPAYNGMNGAINPAYNGMNGAINPAYNSMNVGNNINGAVNPAYGWAANGYNSVYNANLGQRYNPNFNSAYVSPMPYDASGSWNGAYSSSSCSAAVPYPSSCSRSCSTPYGASNRWNSWNSWDSSNDSW